ncbi:Fe2+ or Zn2+ uptake regulation protein [Sphingopyxis sp. YR583]|nr:Fe2+ or Zn2+ uptake regulation protein [Sphingopyxis sp. YR583]
MPDDRERRSSKDEAGGADADGIERKRTSAILEAIVLSILCASHVPLGAYAIARQARALGTPMAPNQIYRALDRLGPRVRRVETLNAYMEDAGTPGAIMLCRICGRIDALDVQIDTAIDRLCGAAGFQSARVIAEIVGICARCRSTEASIDREAREQPQ